MGNTSTKKLSQRTLRVSRKPAFLLAYLSTASVTKAAKAAKIDRILHYRWLREDPEYAVDFAAAQNEAAQILEDEAVRRAHQGTRKPIYYQGEKCGVVLEYSDSLLMFLLKAFRPDKYRERSSLEVAGPDGGPIQLEDKRFALLSDDELAALIATAAKLSA